MAKKKTNGDESEVPFEESLEQLEQAVRQLEEGQCGLSDSLQCYEAGVKHLKQCYQALEAAERKIELLTGVDAEGHPLTQPLEDAELSLEDKAAARSQRRSRPAASSAARDEPDEADAPGTLF